MGVHNVYKDDRYGLDLIQDEGPGSNNGVFLHKMLPKHSLIVRAIYASVAEMKFWVVSNPLPQVNSAKYQMYAVNPNPNVHNYKAIIAILDHNWGQFEYRVQNYPPNWA